jgi:hypothetical protein
VWSGARQTRTPLTVADWATWATNTMPKQQIALSQRKKTIRDLNNINNCIYGRDLGVSPQAPSIRAPYLAQVRTLPQNPVFALA